LLLALLLLQALLNDREACSLTSGRAFTQLVLNCAQLEVKQLLGLLQLLPNVFVLRMS
jgi:hypothetical protein